MKTPKFSPEFLTAALIYLAFIYASLPWARSFLNRLYQVWPAKELGLMADLWLAAIAWWVVLSFWRRMGWFALPFFLAAAGLLFYGWHLSRPEEKIHLVEYALLGLLLERSFPSPRGLWLAFFLVTISGVLDEIIQYFLPNRVFDPRDIFMNVTSGVFGVCLARFGLF